MGDRPQARKDDVEDGIDQDRVRHGEEAHRAFAEHQRRDGDKGIGGVEIAAEQEPGDDSAEAPAAEPPFMQEIEVGLPPARRHEAEPGHEQEQDDEDTRRGQIERHRMSPGTPVASLPGLFGAGAIFRSMVKTKSTTPAPSRIQES